MKRSTTTILAVVATLLTSCVVPPQQHTFSNTASYNTDFDTTWSKLIQFFTTHSIQIKTIEKASGVLYAEQAFTGGSNFAQYADCGQPGLFRVIGTGAALNVFVAKDGAGTRVTVNTVFRQRRQFENDVTTVDCTSTGGLEQQVLAALR